MELARCEGEVRTTKLFIARFSAQFLSFLHPDFAPQLNFSC